jgi:hypothetical protein
MGPGGSRHTRGLGALLLLVVAAAAAAGGEGRQAATSPLRGAGSVAAAAADLGRQFYVAPSGTPDGDGSAGNPWTLREALGHPETVSPGDTIWLRGGTYRPPPGDSLWSTLRGTAARPILVRAVPGERVTIDGGDSGGRTILIVQGAYTWYWGFEITSSDTRRASAQTGPAPTDMPRGAAIDVEQFAPHPGLRFINLVLHDARAGIGWWQQAVDSEISGCLIYNNGWLGPDRGHGHGIYAQNAEGTKIVRDSILFGNFSHNFHAYAEDAPVQGFVVTGNSFLGFVDPAVGLDRNFLAGGSAIARDLVVRNNVVYSPSGSGSDFRVGYSSPVESPVIVDNYLPRTGVDARMVGMPVVIGNTLSRDQAQDFSSYPENLWLPGAPSGTALFVRRDAYEPGRAMLVVLNWADRDFLDWEDPTVLPAGSRFELRNAFDYFAPPLAAGVHAGGPLRLPLRGLSTSSPVGRAPVPPRSAAVQAFVLRAEAAGRRIEPGIAPRPRVPRVATPRPG